MKLLKLNIKVTHDDVKKAVKRFLSTGGIIVKLPKQQNPLRPVVGGEKHQTFDSLVNLIN